jgi:predicted acylesterase/phospholipase RssA
MQHIDRRRLLQLSGAGAVAVGSSVVPAQAARSQPQFIILSCDGGGIRGLITALLLHDLDPAFLQKVSLFAGTSTGSIIALGLAAGISIDQIVQLYRSMSNCRDIFTPYLSFEQMSAVRAQLRTALSAPPPNAAAGIDWNKLYELLEKALAELAFPKYQSSGLQALLASILPSLTLAQLASEAGKFVVAPSFQINDGSASGGMWQPVLFHNLPGLPYFPDLSGTSLVDAVMCSTAAPTFFPPHQLSAGAFVDGGLAANNPCATAIAAILASSLAAEDGLTPRTVAAVSIGTGNVANSYPPSASVFPYGILGWMWPYQDGPAPVLPLIQGMFAGSSGIDDKIAAALLRESTYIRVNPLFATTWSLDDCAAIEQMAELTMRYIATAEWKNFKKQINALALS